MASWSTKLRFFRFSGEESCDVLGISAVGTVRGDLNVKKEMWETQACAYVQKERGEVGGPEKLEVLCLERVSKRATRSPSLMEEDCTLNFTWNTMNAIQNNTRLFILKLAMKAFFFFAHRITKQFKCTQKRLVVVTGLFKKKFFFN